MKPIEFPEQTMVFAEHDQPDPCPHCGGDGIETCNNPDHAFIDLVGGEIGRLGCPGCGNDPYHKMRNACPECNGTGKVNWERRCLAAEAEVARLRALLETAAGDIGTTSESADKWLDGMTGGNP